MGKYGFSVYLGGISDRVRTGDVEDFFKGYGKILDIALKSKYGNSFHVATELWHFFKDLLNSKINMMQKTLWKTWTIQNFAENVFD